MRLIEAWSTGTLRRINEQVGWWRKRREKQPTRADVPVAATCPVCGVELTGPGVIWSLLPARSQPCSGPEGREMVAACSMPHLTAITVDS